MTQRIQVGVLGATGTVGQRFVQLLDGHPWFELSALAASERSAGQRYADACAWKLPTPMPEAVKDLIVSEPTPGAIDAPVVFSGLTSDAATSVEPAFAEAGHAVISNASSFRMAPDVPLLIPEINADHVDLIETQRRTRGWPGFIVTNPNCSTIALCLALAPLEDQFGIDQVVATTLQAISGAGYPGLPSLDIMGNVLPNIPKEETKMENETRKIFGQLTGDRFEAHEMALSVTTTRVPVVEGHTESVSISLAEQPAIDEVQAALHAYRSLPQERDLPSAPCQPVVVTDDPDRPQPRLDNDREAGMATVVGRLRPCPVLGIKLVLLGHNTLRGAAGASVLNAELLHAEGVLPRS
ncbi:MAG: aspartate-semialdehyde dehydrogenase [Candidatus Bipolaricaulia bacterium]